LKEKRAGGLHRLSGASTGRGGNYEGTIALFLKDRVRGGEEGGKEADTDREGWSQGVIF